MHVRHLLIALSAAAATACGGRDDGTATSGYPAAPVAPTAHHHSFAAPSEGPLPVDELKDVRVATARYNDVNNATADGYIDINVVIPNMGRHFLRPEVQPAPGEVPVDGNVDLKRPELLVYSPQPDGGLKLVAVEYAVPRKLFDVPPEG